MLATLCEIVFTAHTGITIELKSLGSNSPIASMFTEVLGLGAVIQVKKENVVDVLTILEKYEFSGKS
ncbi:hypothetical protein [Candidatus Coxiella mudrowiae]|uniref:hypothetical protein n=1 Tax=Candidatus Coxiella mudrowiae TaxID=2054173 RepID=UPI001FD2A328|nr:hypothetical protein [Candidatus Coxiella mudrowiae]